uniref:Uncharacterized protein n=2 Tax=Avena sativa TaxID=4498 RepID=A0ACD5YGF3_AVESA
MGTGRRRKLDGDDSDEEYVAEEDLCVSSAAEEDGDAEYEVDEEEEEETPRPVKGARKRKSNPAARRPRKRSYEVEDEDYSEESGDYQEDLDDEEEEEPPRLNSKTECGGRSQPPVSQRSNRRHEEEDADFDPELDEGEEDRDMDFDPELEGDDEEFEDEEEEEFDVSHARKVPRIQNTVRRIPASKRRCGKKKKKNSSSSSKVSKRKVRSAKKRKAAPATRRRKREHYEDDDDFIVEEDQVKVNRNSRKKARFGRQVELDRPVPVAEADIWPAIDSDTSDFEFGTSDEEHENVVTPVVEPVRVAVRKGRKKKASGSSSDSEFHVLDEELRDVRDQEVKKRTFVLQSSSDSEFHVSETELGTSRETERKKSVFDSGSSSDSDFNVSDKESGHVRKDAKQKKNRVFVSNSSSDSEFNGSDKEMGHVRKEAKKKKNSVFASGSSSDSEFHVLDEELRDVRDQEVKKRTFVLQSTSDSEFHVSETELGTSRETERKKSVFDSGSSSHSDFNVADKELGHVRKEAKKKKNSVFVSGSSSEAEIHVSDEELGHVREEEAKRKKRVFVSGSCSDSEFHGSDKDFREVKPLEAQPMLPVSVRRISFTRNGEDKGKEKKEVVDAGKHMCGICLSDDQTMTLQGMLDCCSHYFCFACIMEWSKVESRCPLCKRRFTTITKSSKVDLGSELKKAVIRVEERDQVYQPTEEEIRRWLDPYENLVCIECNQGGEDSLMLLCDICDSSAHTYCVGLGREVPEGNWYCGGCRLGAEGTSYPRSLSNSNSAQLAATAPIGTFERSPSINPWQTFQGFDLNALPREVSRQNHPTESRASTASVSTSSGGRLATLSRRRGWIRILLDRQRPAVSLDLGHNGVQNSDYVPRAELDHMNFFASSESNSLQHGGYLSRIEPSRRNLHAPSEANTSQLLLDDIRDQHYFSPSVQTQRNSTPCISVDGNNFQQTESVQHMCSISPH